MYGVCVCGMIVCVYAASGEKQSTAQVKPLGVGVYGICAYVCVSVCVYVCRCMCIHDLQFQFKYTIHNNVIHNYVLHNSVIHNNVFITM